jgi:DNA topoisomerase VI subunit B
MPGRIGKYTYENKSVLKEFLSSLIKAMAGRKAKEIKKQLAKDPEMRKIMVRIKKNDDDWNKLVAKKRKADPEYDKRLKKAGL